MSLLFPKRVIAALLPFTFLWAFMACVSICEKESLATHSPVDRISSIGVNEFRQAPKCEGCPVAYFSKSTTPERAKFIIDLQPLSTLVPAISSVISSQQYSVTESVVSPLCNSSPPLKLLSKLRI